MPTPESPLSSSTLLDSIKVPKRSAQRWRNQIRTIKELEWARFLGSTESPPHKNVQLKGTQAEGKAYERKVTKYLVKLAQGSTVFAGAVLEPRTWIKFEDLNGFGWAQPDVVAVQSDLVWIFECKRTHSLDARDQLALLYSPLVAHIFPSHEQILIEVCKHMVADPDGRRVRTIHDLDAIYSSPPQDHYVWHWHP